MALTERLAAPEVTVNALLLNNFGDKVERVLDDVSDCLQHMSSRHTISFWRILRACSLPKCALYPV